MLKIEFDPSTLSKTQREDLASFILGWDNGALNGTITEVQHPKSAPLSADAGPSSTAPVDTQVNTSTGIAPLPPVPQPVFPANTAAPQSPNPVEVDSKGMPWDARIHSSSKTKVTDGTWKYKRGVSDEEVKAVEYESRADNMDAAALFTAPSPPIAIIGANDVKVGCPQLDGTISGIAPPPPLGALPAMSGVSEPDLRKEFAQLMIRVAQAKGAGKITAEEVTAALAAHGVPSLPMLSTKLDLVPSVAAAIDEIIASRG